MISVSSSYSDINKLNDAFDAAAAEYDKLFDSLDKTTRNALGKTWSDWQDFYYSNMDNPPTNFSSVWVPILKKAVDLMIAAKIEGGAYETAVVNVVPSKPVVKIEEPTYIYGKVEPKPVVYVDADGYPVDYNAAGYDQLEYEESEIPWLWIIGGVVGMGILYKMTKKKAS